MMSRLNGFLRGVRILDLSRHYPGPLATMLLADLGADVLKIEPPVGDELRDMGPKDSEGRSLCFEAINAGKRTRRMNLRNADVRKEFLGLVDQADVLVESFRPGVMARLGVGYPTLKERNPRLIYCSLNGFGDGGSPSAGHDINYAANRLDWIPQQHEQQVQATLIAEVEAQFAGMSLAAAVGRFQPADCCFSPVVELTEALSSDHHRQRGVVQRAASGAVQALFPAIVDGQASAPRPALRDMEANPWSSPSDTAPAASGRKR